MQLHYHGIVMGCNMATIVTLIYMDSQLLSVCALQSYSKDDNCIQYDNITPHAVKMSLNGVYS